MQPFPFSVAAHTDVCFLVHTCVHTLFLGLIFHIHKFFFNLFSFFHLACQRLSAIHSFSIFAVPIPQRQQPQLHLLAFTYLHDFHSRNPTLTPTSMLLQQKKNLRKKLAAAFKLLFFTHLHIFAAYHTCFWNSTHILGNARPSLSLFCQCNFQQSTSLQYFFIFGQQLWAAKILK